MCLSGMWQDSISIENGVTVPLYEVAVIDREKPATVDNLLVFCPMCQATYSFDSNKKTRKELA